MRRKSLTQERLQLRDVDVAAHHIGGQRGGHRAADADHDSGIDRRMCGQCRLDLAEFNPQTTEFHLIVATAVVLQHQLAGGTDPPGHDVAGAIHTFARPERGGNETPGGQRRLIEIAARQGTAHDVELTADPDRNRPQPLVEHHQIDPGHRSAHPDRLPGLDRIADRDQDGGLSRPVDVVQTRVPEPVFDQPTRHDLTARGDMEQIRQIRRFQGRQHRRGQEGVRDPLVAHELLQLWTAHRRTGTVGQRAPRLRRQQILQHRGIETRRRETKDDRCIAGLQSAGLLRTEVRQAGVRDGHTLRPSGRSGCVDHIGGVVRARFGPHRNRRPRVARTDLGDRVGPVDMNPLEALVRQLPSSTHRQPEHRTGILDHCRDPLRGVVRIDRHVAAARLGHRPNRGQQLNRPRDRQCDQRFHPDSTIDKPARKLVGPLIQLGVRQRGTGTVDNRDTLRPPLCRPGE